jgi:WD40 repeat protein
MSSIDNTAAAQQLLQQTQQQMSSGIGTSGGIRAAILRPKENVLLSTLREHTRAVSRIAVSPDQLFFASASMDKTIKVWQTKYLDRVAFPRLLIKYLLHDCLNITEGLLYI